MSRRRDQLVPVVAFVALAAVGVLILVLLNNAVDHGRAALEDSLVTEVDALARSQNASLAGQFGSVGPFLAGRTLDFEVNSANDRAEFADIASLLEEAGARTSFFFTDADGVVTQGFQLRDRSVVGRPLDRPGFSDTLAALRQIPSDGQDLPGAYLPVAPGLTTEAPTYALVIAIREDRTSALRGTLVFESEVSSDSTLNQQITPLRHGDTGEYLIVGTTGTVIAATNPSLVAQHVPDDSYLTDTAGFHRRHGEVVVLADVPASGWRIAFVQDSSEFEQGLAGPLQRAGQIVVVAFLVFGLIAFVALGRRLRAARDEQARLQRLTESQEEFISIVSHELRTPVAGVLGFLQTTMDHWESMTETERFNALRRSASNARRLQGLTRDVLDSQAVEAGRMSYAMADADLAEEVTVAVEAASALYPRLHLDADMVVERAPVHVDVDRIQQVLTNLLDNAAKASPPDGTISVRLWTDSRSRPGVGHRSRSGALARDARSGVRQVRAWPYVERHRHRPRPVHLPPDPRGPRRDDLGERTA